MTKTLYVARTARSMLNSVDRMAVVPAPLAAPTAWFGPPSIMTARGAAGVPTKLNLVLEGPETARVYGDVAPLGQCILDGRPGCWSVPGPSEDDLSYSMQGVYTTDEGDEIPVGIIPMDLNHAPGDGTATEAVDFMANTGVQLAIVRYLYTPWSIAACGVLAPGVTWGQAVRARAAAQSGDWRALLTEIHFDDGRPSTFRFTGSIAVNLPGFPLAARAAAAADRPWVGRAIIIQQEVHTVPETTITPTRTAGVAYVLEPKPLFAVNDEVRFAGGQRRGRVVGSTSDEEGNVLVTVQEAFDSGMLADDDSELLSLPGSECVGTGQEFTYESYTTDGSTPEVDTPDVVLLDTDDPVMAAAPACSCHTQTAAGNMPPVDPTVTDPTPDILLAGLASLQAQVDAVSGRCDSLEAAIAASHEVAQVAAALHL